MNDTHDLELYHASTARRYGNACSPPARPTSACRSCSPRVGAVSPLHVASSSPDNTPRGRLAEPGGTKLVMDNGRWLINPGGVGQPPRRRPPGGVGPARHRDVDRHLAARRYPIDEAAKAIEEAASLPSLGNVSAADSE